MASPADDPKDVLDFKFRSIRRIRLHEESAIDQIPKEPTQKLVISNVFGLVFAAGPNSLHCLSINDIEKADEVDKETRKIDLNQKGFVLNLPSNPSHIALNSDETILAVGLNINKIAHFYLFDTRLFANGEKDIKPFLEIPGINPPNVVIKEAQWNPVVPQMFAVVFSNGALAMYLVKSDGSKFDTSTLPPGEGISCISWSPKGKQLVAGRTNGKLTQYKPDLSQAKTMEPPQDGGQYSVSSILWISTYQFLVCFKSLGSADARPGLYLVQGSKAGPTTYINYDDICYSTGEAREAYFNMFQISEWSLIISASYNAMEVGVIGSEDSGVKWVQWLLPDSGRAELPLKSNSDERFPVGMALALNTIRKLPKEENQFMPFSMPLLLILSGDGLLCGFYAVNEKPNAVQVTKNEWNQSPEIGIRRGTIQVPMGKVEEKVKAAPLIANPPQPPPPSFEASFVASTPIKSEALKPIIAKPIPQEPPKIIQPIAKAPAVVPVQKSESGEIRDSFKNAIKEEILAFQQELVEMRKKASTLKVDIGTPEEKTALKVDCFEMEKFCKDLVEITSSQNQEVHDLQSKTLETFEWAEEARSRDVRNKDPKYQRLLKARALDPLSQRRLSNVQSKYLFMEQQIDDLNMKLDLEWEEHLENCKKGASRLRKLETSSKDTLYRVLVNHTSIIESQKAILNNIEQQVKELKMRNVISSSHDDTDDDNLEKLSKSLLDKTRLKTNESTPERAKKLVASPGFSPEKTMALKTFLNRKGTTKVKPDPELSKSRSEAVNKSKSKELVQALQITESKAKQTLAFKPEPVKAQEAPKSAFSMNTSSSLMTKPPSTASTMSSFNLSSSGDSKPLTLSSFPTTTSALPKLPTPSFSFASNSPKKSEAPLASSFGSNLPSFGSLGGQKTSEAPSSFGSIAAPKTTTTTLNLGTKPLTTGSAFGVPGGIPANVTISKVAPTTTSGASPSLLGTPTSAPNKSMFGLSAQPPANVTISNIGSSINLGSATSPPKPVVTTASVTPPTTTRSIFGGLGTSTVTTTAPGTTSSSTSVFGGSAPSVAATTASAFGGLGSSATTTSSVFGATSTTSTAFGGSKEPTKSIFGATSAASSSVFGGLSGTTSVFGSASTTTTTSTPTTTSIFGTSSTPTATTTSTSTKSIFATPSATTTSTTTATTTSSVFGTSSSSTSVFGTASSGSTSVFGGSAPSTTSTTTTSAFGGFASTSTTAASASVFGGTTTTSSAFGGSKEPNKSIFGGSPAAPVSSSGGSVFGGQSGSVFGAASTTTGFGSNKSTAPAVGTTATSSTSGSVFGTPSSTGSAFGGSSSIFGSAPTSSAPSSSAPSAFSAPASTASGTFGSQSTSVFGGKPAFGGQSSSLFGGATSTTSATATTSSTSVFGGTSTSSGNSGGGSLFGGSASGGGGGGFFSGLGASPSANNANKNVFGGSTFGSTPSTTAQSLFGGSSASPAVTSTSSFGGNASSPFGGSGQQQSGFGSFSGGGTSVTSQGFGAQAASPSRPGASGGFGSPPTFGGAPSFGAAPTFGSSPSAGFGASATFGSGASFGGGATFGSASAASGGSLFGGGASNAPTFGSVAQSSNSGSTFGSLAQSGGNTFGSGGGSSGGFGASSPQASSGFGSSSGGGGVFGSSPPSAPSSGSSFSSWR